MIRFLRYILHHFMNNERVISRLAESRPIRRGAQIVASIILRSKDLKLTHVNSVDTSGLLKRLQSFMTRFKKEIEQAKEDIKKRQK